jgi:hypothetical protein
MATREEHFAGSTAPWQMPKKKESTHGIVIERWDYVEVAGL